MSAPKKYEHLFFAMFLALALTFPVLSFAQMDNNPVFAKIDTNQIQIGQPLTLTIGINLSNLSTPLEWPALSDTITNKLEIINIQNTDTQTVNSGFVISKKIAITSFDSGYHVIPPVTFLVDGKPVETDPLLMVVNTVSVDTTLGFKDIAEIYTPPFSLSEWLVTNSKVIAVSGLLAIAALVVYLVFFKNKKTPEKIVKEAPKLPAHVIALNRLNELNEQKLWQSNKLKEFYSTLSDILREYIENQFAINALEKTTDEILEILKRDGMDTDNKQLLFKILFRADMVKFAKEKPLPDENETSFKNALKFVEKTKPTTIETTNTVLEN